MVFFVSIAVYSSLQRCPTSCCHPYSESVTATPHQVPIPTQYRICCVKAPTARAMAYPCCLGDHSRALLSAMRVIYRTGSWPKSWDLLLPCRGWLSSMNRQLFLLLHDLLGWASSDDMPMLFGIFLAGYSPAQPPWLVSAPAIPTSSAGPQ